MSTEPLADLEPLINDINREHIGYFLKTDAFKKRMQKRGLLQIWDKAYKQACNSRGYFAMDLDHKAFDSLDAFIIIANSLYLKDRNSFYGFIHFIIDEFHNWKEKEIHLPFQDLIEDYGLLSFPDEYIDKLRVLDAEKNKDKPFALIPDELWGAVRLNDILTKIDRTIHEKNYNLSLTYCYSALEGMFKAYIKVRMAKDPETDKLQQLASLVRDHAKTGFREAGVDFPESMLNLIPTITNAVSAARNSHSDSHFDRSCDDLTAGFARDCVNSIGNVVIKLMVL